MRKMLMIKSLLLFILLWCMTLAMSSAETVETVKCTDQVTFTVACVVPLRETPSEDQEPSFTLPAGTEITWIGTEGSRWALVSAEADGAQVTGYTPVWVIRPDCPRSPRLTPGLFAAKGPNGLWGFIEAEGAFVIQPKYQSAEGFVGRFGLVHDGTQTLLLDESGAVVHQLGDVIIDRGYDGFCYGGIDTGIALVLGDDQTTWIDLQTGYWSGEDGWTYGEYPWLESSPVVLARDEKAMALVKRDSGEMVRVLGNWDWHDLDGTYFGFVDGYCELIVWEDDEETGGVELREWLFLDEKGNIVHPEEGYCLVEDPGAPQRCGLAVVVCEENDLFGYLSMETGRCVIPAVYREAWPYEANGMALVRFPEGDYGHIDTQGRVMARGFREPYSFHGRYAMLEHAQILIDEQGRTAAEIPAGWRVVETYDTRDGNVGYTTSQCMFGDETMILYATDRSMRYRLMRRDGTFPMNDQYLKLDAAYYDGADCLFSEGLLVAQDPDTGLYGAVDAEGRTIVPFIYQHMENYRNGLSRFATATHSGYLDHEGRVVCDWAE